MRWVLGGIAILVVLVALAGLVAPRLIDWDAYRSEVEQAFVARTGLQAEIGGELHMALLPAPTLFARDVRLAPAGDGTPAFADVAALRAELALWPLLLGEVRIDAIALERPQLVLRLQRDGSAAAMAVARRLLSGEAAPGGSGTAGTPTLARLSVQDGRVVLLRAERPVAELDGIAIDFLAPAADRTGRLRLEARWRELPFALSLDIGSLGAAGTAALRGRAELAGSLVQASYAGSILATGTDAAAASSEGGLNLTLRNPAALLALLQVPETATAGLPAEPLTLAGRLRLSGDAARLDDIDLRWGRATLGGAASAAFGPPLALDIAAQAAGLELDPLLPLLAALAPGAQERLHLPESDRIAFDVSGTALRLRGSVVRQVQLSGRLDQGQLDLQELRAELPGSTTLSLKGRLTATGGLAEFAGTAAVEASDARRALAWLGVPEARLPATGPRRLQAQAELALDAGLWRAVGLSASLDGATVQGGIALRPSGRPSFSANLRLADLELDPWLAMLQAHLDPATTASAPGGAADGPAAPQSPGGQGESQADPAGTGAAAGRAAAGQAGPAPLPVALLLRQAGSFLSGFDSNLRLAGQHLSWRGARIAEARLDLMLVRGALTLSRATAVTEPGLALELSGSATAEPEALAYDLAVDAQAARLAALPGLEPAPGLPAAGGLVDAAVLAHPLAEPLRVQLRLTGDADQALLREIEIRLPGGRVSGRGTLGLEPVVPSLAADLDWALHAPELFHAAIGQPEFRLRRHPASGRLTLTVDAGAVTIGDASLVLPMLALSGEGSLSRGETPAQFRLAVEARAPSLPALLDGLGAAGPRAVVAADAEEAIQAAAGAAAPLSLRLRAAGRTDGFALEEARLALGDAVLQLDGSGSLAPVPTLRGSLQLGAPELARLLAGTGLAPLPAEPELGPVRLQARYRVEDSRIVVEDASGTAGPAAVAAALGFDWGAERPLLQADLHLAGLPLDRLLPRWEAARAALLPVLATEPAGAARGLGPPMPLRLDLGLSAEDVSAGGGDFADGAVEARLQDGSLRLSRLEGRLFGGRLSGKAALDLRGLPAVEAEAELQGLDSAALLRRLGIGGLQGRTDASLRLRSAGETPEAMLQRLSGQAELSLERGRLEGIDLPAVAALAAEAAAREGSRIPTPSPLEVEAALLGGSTAIALLSGTLFVESGVLRLQDIAAELEGGSATWHGSVSLPAQALDLTGSYRLASRPQAPPVEVEVRGPLSAPQWRVLPEAFAQYLFGRAIAARAAAPAPAAPSPADGPLPDEPGYEPAE